MRTEYLVGIVAISAGIAGARPATAQEHSDARVRVQVVRPVLRQAALDSALAISATPRSAPVDRRLPAGVTILAADQPNPPSARDPASHRTSAPRPWMPHPVAPIAGPVVRRTIAFVAN